MNQPMTALTEAPRDTNATDEPPIAAEAPAANAIRQELLKMMMDDAPLSVAKLERVEHIARTGKALLQALNPDVDLKTLTGRLGQFGVNPALSSFGQSFASSSPSETFGAKIMRDIQKVIPALTSRPKPTPSPLRLVEAISFAKKEGMEDVQAMLQAKLADVLADEPSPDAPEQPAGDAPSPLELPLTTTETIVAMEGES